MAASGPPRPNLVLNVGITGHRAHVLSDKIVEELEKRFDSCFRRLTRAVDSLAVKWDGVFSDTKPKLKLHTALATGADQLAASSAQRNGYQVRALLPFAVEEYERDFKERGEHREFCQQLDKTDGYFALPGDRQDEEGAYVMVGKAVIAAADILIAVWDGHEGNGPGGTAHVVDLALRTGVPILHIPVDRENETLGATRLLIGGDAIEPEVGKLDNSADFEAIIAEVIAPGADIDVPELKTFFTEQEKTFNPRIEYPLMLAILGIKRITSAAWMQAPLQPALEAYSARSNHAYPRQAAAYEWSNFLAIRYAQLFRSGHTTNYMMAAYAVLVALGGLLVPDIKPALVVCELILLGLLFLNTRVGSAGEWHRKWLQYRHLAESLRPLPYLKRTGLIGPPFRNEHVSGERGRGAAGDWTRWYAAALWRDMPNPEGLMDKEAMRALVEEVRIADIEDQVAYHRVNAARMHTLDHRLHLVGEIVMSAVILACGLYLILDMLAPLLLHKLTYFFVFVTAGFPALGAAVFGLRGLGEHLLAASRSHNTADALADNSEKLARVTELDSLARELERTAQIMLADLNEWTVAYSERALQVPG